MIEENQPATVESVQEADQTPIEEIKESEEVLIAPNDTTQAQSEN